MRHDTPAENYLDLKRDLERVVETLEDINPENAEAIQQISNWKDTLTSIKSTVIEKIIVELRKEL